MAESKYKAILQTKDFNTNWQTNLESSLLFKEKQVRAQIIINGLLPNKSKPLLNAGSNIGFHSMLATTRGFKVVSLDPSMRALREGITLGWIDEAICGDVMNLPFRDNSFSNVILSEVIEEIPQQFSALLQLGKCCNRIIVTTSPIKSDVLYDIVKKAKRILRKKATEDAHVGELHPDVLEYMLEKSGFVLKKTFFRNPFHIWNVVAILPLGEMLDLSILDKLLASKWICASLIVIAERKGYH